MSWIRNVSMGDIKTGQYLQFAKDTSEDVLIQIVDLPINFLNQKVNLNKFINLNF